jgi:phosphate transport system permease protein
MVEPELDQHLFELSVRGRCAHQTRLPRLTLNPLDTVTTVTVQIVTLLTGDQEFNSTKTLSAFGLGLTLFLVTLVLNIVAQRIVQTYRQQYD